MAHKKIAITWEVTMRAATAEGTYFHFVNRTAVKTHREAAKKCRRPVPRASAVHGSRRHPLTQPGRGGAFPGWTLGYGSGRVQPEKALCHPPSCTQLTN